MAFYVMHDSFIRPRTTTVLNTRKNLNRENAILTKNEKRKFKIYEKENIPIISCDDNDNKYVKATLFAVEDSLDEIFETANDLTPVKVESKNSEQFWTKQKSIFKQHLEAIRQVLNYPKNDTVELTEYKCQKMKHNKHIEKVNAVVMTEPEPLFSVNKNTDLILNLSRNETEEIIEDTCECSEAVLLKSEAIEIIEDPSLGIALIQENILQLSEEPFEKRVPINFEAMNAVNVKKEAFSGHVFTGIKHIFNQDCSTPKRPERAKRDANNNRIYDMNKINIKSSLDGFIHNHLGNANVNDAHPFNTTDRDCDEDELPNLEFVDKNIVMQEALQRRSEVDINMLRKSLAEKLTTVSNLESNNLKRHEDQMCNYDTSKKPSKARSRFISPRNKMDRTIEKEYRVYKSVLESEKLKKINNNGKERRESINDTKIQCKETNININLSCNSTGLQ